MLKIIFFSENIIRYIYVLEGNKSCKNGLFNIQTSNNRDFSKG